MKKLSWSKGGWVVMASVSMFFGGCETSKQNRAAQSAIPVPVRDPQPVPVGFQPGKGEVLAVHGKAKFSLQGEQWAKLKLGAVLRPGTAVWVGTNSSVNILLGINGPLILLTNKSLLVINSLAYKRADSEMTIDTRFFLQEGQMLANVKRLATNSNYEVRTPTGLMKGLMKGQVGGAGDYYVNADGRLGVLGGSPVEYNFGGKNYVIKTGELFDPGTREVSKLESKYYRLVEMRRLDPPPQPPPSGWPQRKF